MKHKQQKIRPERRGNLQYQASLRCKYCGCETNEDVIKAAHWTRKGLIVIEDIPVRQCQGCREEFFKKEIAQRIQKVVTYPAAKAKQQIRVPVYSLSKVRAAEKRRPAAVSARAAPIVPHRKSKSPTAKSTHIRHQLVRQSSCRQAKQTTEPIRANQSCQETLLCKYCGSVTVNDMVKSVLWVDGRLIAIENIPARVCQRCREQFYDDQTIEKMTTLAKRGFVPGTARRDVSVPVFSLADVKESSGKRPLLRKN